MLFPCAPSGIAHPMITSSTSVGSSPGARRKASLTAAPAMSSGYVVLSVPRGALPTAVRAPETITASFIVISLLVSERFACREQRLNPLHGLLIVQELEEG